MSYRCSTCGELHKGLPDLGIDRPDYYWLVPEEERTTRIELTSDTCVIDNEDYFIRGVIEIPLVGQSEKFCFGFGYRRSMKTSRHIWTIMTPAISVHSLA